MFYIDESGSIPKHKSDKYKYRYFVIGFIHTDNPKKLKSVYKQSIRNLRKHFPDFFSSLNDPNEMKGSEALPFMKLYIFERLVRKTDIKIGHLVVDNWITKDSFRLQPSRSFNYLVKVMMNAFSLSQDDKECLYLKIDNRNSAIKSLKSLEDYLHQELILEDEITDSVSVEYLDSCIHPGIQIADLVTNTIYQSYRYGTAPFQNVSSSNPSHTPPYFKTYKYLYDILKPRIVTPFEYPPYSAADQAAATLRREQGNL